MLVGSSLAANGFHICERQRKIKKSTKIKIRVILHRPRKKILTKILEINVNLPSSFTHGRI